MTYMYTNVGIGMGRGSVKRVVDQYGVYLDEQCLGTFGALIDAHAFLVQLIDRGMAAEVRMYSGEVISEYVASRYVA